MVSVRVYLLFLSTNKSPSVGAETYGTIVQQSQDVVSSAYNCIKVCWINRLRCYRCWIEELASSSLLDLFDVYGCASFIWYSAWHFVSSGSPLEFKTKSWGVCSVLTVTLRRKSNGIPIGDSFFSSCRCAGCKESVNWLALKVVRSYQI